MHTQRSTQSVFSENTALLHTFFRPVILPPDLIGHAAPCDFFSARGTLVVKAGAMISQRAYDPFQAQRIFCEAEQAHHLSTLDPLTELQRVSQSLSHIAKRVARGALVIADEIHVLAHQVFEAWFLDADACLGYARLSHYGAPGACHSLHVALLAAELADAHGFQDKMIESLIGAALTMNLAKLALHDEMFNWVIAPSAALRQEMRTHPSESALLLRKLGKFDAAWIDAVAQHHENVDGSGYPAGLKGAEISLPARMLRIADTLAARLTGRKGRAPQHWNMQHARGDIHHMVTHVFGADLAKLDSTLCHKLLRVLHRFPPGSLVRLSNNELAVVTRRLPDQALSPLSVLTVCDKHGMLLPTPSARRITPRQCEIRAYAHDALPKLGEVDWRSAWGYGV